MTNRFYIEDFVRQRLGDRELEDYFPGERELTNICFRNVPCRESRISLDFLAIEERMTPLPTPGVSSTGSYWAYPFSYYTPSLFRVLGSCGCVFPFDRYQPNHKYALFQANAYLDGEFCDPQPDIDEVGLTAAFDTPASGELVVTGLVISINRLMNDIFKSIADDIAKLAIYQSTLGGATDLREARQQANFQAAAWLTGSYISVNPLKGIRR